MVSKDIVKDAADKRRWLTKKRKILKRMKKMHVLPPILVLCVMMLVFFTLTFGVIILYFTIEAGSQFGEPIRKLVSVRDQSAESDLDYAKIIKAAELTKEDSVNIVDQAGKPVYTMGKKRFRTKRYERMPDVFTNKENIHLVADYDDLLQQAMHNIPSLIILEEADGVEEVSFWLEQECFQTDAWLYSDMLTSSDRIYLYSPIVMLNRDMVVLWILIFFALLVNLIPIVIYIISNIRNILSWYRMRRIYYLDTVSLGTNWQFFIDHMNKKRKKLLRKGLNPVVVCLHMDKYRNYSICYGKQEGEWLIRMMDRTLRKELKRTELFARNYDGEFGLLLQMEDEQGLEQRLIHLEQQIRNLVPEHPISFTVGIAAASDKSMDAEEVYLRAGIARASITAGESTGISWFDEKMREERLWELHVEECQQQALEQKEFQVYIQPKHSPVTGEMIGGEALIRWISPTEGFIGPGRFIPIFEKNGFIIHIDDYMISSLARLQSEWIKKGKKVVPVSVNVSRVHFADPGLAEHICRLVDQYQVPRELIELEITESAFFEDKDALLTTVRKLKEMGFKLSMDDFGTGYSSMNSLRELPLDILKLDAAFFRGKDEQTRGRIVVSDTIRLAKHLNMRIVAEGVEEKEQVDFLAGEDCDMIQGFYFAKPMPAAEYEERLAES